MLSKNARKVLKIANKEPEKKIAYLDLKSKLAWDFDKVKSACDQLVSADMATVKYYSPIPGSSVMWGIVLNEHGRNSRKYFWIGAFEFLFKSIVIPIIVAFATTLITLWVQGYLFH